MDSGYTICAGMYLKTRPQMQFVFAFFAYIDFVLFLYRIKRRKKWADSNK